MAHAVTAFFGYTLLLKDGIEYPDTQADSLVTSPECNEGSSLWPVWRGNSVPIRADLVQIWENRFTIFRNVKAPVMRLVFHFRLLRLLLHCFPLCAANS